MSIEIIYSPFLEYAISGNKDYLSNQDTQIPKMRELEERLIKLVQQLGLPVLRCLKEYIGIQQSSEIKIYFSNEIHNSIFGPFILKHSEKSLNLKGIISWERQMLIGIIQGFTHVLGKSYDKSKLPFSPDEISHLSQVDRNHLLYNAMLYPVLSNLFPQEILLFFSGGSQKDVWSMIEKKGFEAILRADFSMLGTSFNYPKQLQIDIHDLFDRK